MMTLTRQVRWLLCMLGAVVGVAMMNISQHPDVGPDAGGNAAWVTLLWGGVLGAAVGLAGAATLMPHGR